MAKPSSFVKHGSMWSAYPVSLVASILAVVVALAVLCSPREAQAQSVAGWGYTGFSNIDNLSNNIVKVAAVGYHTVALKSDGTVACWGYNNSGQTAPASAARHRTSAPSPPSPRAETTPSP